MLILTGQRRDEVAGMRRSEIDGSTWTIPGTRTKNKQTHTVPLSAKVAALITGSDRGRDLIFTTTGTTPVRGLSKVKRQLDAKVGPIPAWRLHDLRRTMATGMCEMVEPHVVEELLNHKIRPQVRSGRHLQLGAVHGAEAGRHGEVGCSRRADHRWQADQERRAARPA